MRRITTISAFFWFYTIALCFCTFKESIMRYGRNHLYVPGPTNVPHSVLSAMHVPMEDHRASDLPELTKPLFADLNKVFKTDKGQSFIFPATGTAG
jgi:aspartate aminotransferase-like enzyme